MVELSSVNASFEALFNGFTQLQMPLRVNLSAWITHVPFAFWLTEATKPKLLVELGAHNGVSFCAFCQQVNKSDITTQCYAVDTWEGDAQAGYYDQFVYEDLSRHVHEHYASFAHLVRSTFDEALPLFKDGSIDVLHIDGYHTYEAMTHDFEAWLPKMSPCGVILMHDINARLVGYGGLRAWDEISERFPSFAFKHGYGLGIVVVGNTPPEKLRLFIEHGRDPGFLEKTQQYFSLLGAMQQRTQDLFLDLEKERHTSCDLRERMDEAARMAQEERNRTHEQTVQKWDQLQKQTRQEIEHYETLLHRYADSFCWKLTWPLRAVANLCLRLCGKPALTEPPTQPPTPVTGEADNERW